MIYPLTDQIPSELDAALDAWLEAEPEEDNNVQMVS